MLVSNVCSGLFMRPLRKTSESHVCLNDWFDHGVPYLSLSILVLKGSAVWTEPVHESKAIVLFSYEWLFRIIFLQLLFFSGNVSHVRLLTYVPCKPPSDATTSDPFWKPHASSFFIILCRLSGQDQHMLPTDWPGHSGRETEHTGGFCSGRALIWAPFPSPEISVNEIHSNLRRCYLQFCVQLANGLIVL